MSKAWSRGAALLHGIHARGFPNLLLSSLIQGGQSMNFSFTINETARQIVYTIARCLEEDVVRVEPTLAATLDWLRIILSSALSYVTYTIGCTPGYFNNEGRTPDNRGAAIIPLLGQRARLGAYPRGLARGRLDARSQVDSPSGEAHMSHRYVALACVAALLACSAPPPITSCAPMGSRTPLCGFQNPEDLALLPGGRHVLVSEYGESGRRAGRLSLLDLASNEHLSLFAGAEPVAPGSWGAPDCAGPPSKAFSPHGIHLAQRTDGSLQLLVVNHGGRESVEMFEVLRDGERWQLAWRGCAEAPNDMLNDLVTLPEGGFLTTRFGPGSPLSFVLALAKATLFGGDTGWVYVWSREHGFKELPGTRGAGPNGIELSVDGAKILLNLTLANEVLRIDRRTGAVEARISLPQPDNSTCTSEGKLLVASLRGTARELVACSGLEHGSCAMPFAIVALNPKTMAMTTVYEGGPGTPSSAATVALEAERTLLIGSYAGDRIVRVDDSAP